MNFSRHIFEELKAWKASADRKPLIVRGARQVGKTTLIKEFSKSYKHRILLNLERPGDLHFFQTYNNAKTILDALFLSNNIESSETGNTLLFLDEIQESPDAIQMLRYFYEDIPELHVIAAGSLLEFAMRKVKSYPVGRVEYLYLHPLNFGEYLLAIGHQTALQQLNHIPVQDFAQRVLIDLFNRYVIIGGMPEVVKKYIQNNSIADLPKTYESIWGSYKNDVEKYAGNGTERKIIKHIINSAHLYIDQRIKFQNFGNSNYRSREVGEAFRNLDDAKIIQVIYPATATEPPVRPDLRKSPRLQFLDTGLLNHALGIQPELLAVQDLSPAYKGAIVPHIITQELMSLNTYSNNKPVFWVREKKQSSSEIDLIYTYQGKVIPIEIKSGSVGKLKSLHQYMGQAKHPYAVRVYAGAFKVEKHKTPKGVDFFLMNLPYCLGTKIPEYIAWFVDNYKL